MARALTAGPQLLLLDEPVAGMNHDEAEELRGLMLQLQARGLSILLIEHDMAFVMNLCHQLYVLDFGVLIAAGHAGRNSRQSGRARRLSRERERMLTVRGLEVFYGADPRRARHRP